MNTPETDQNQSLRKKFGSPKDAIAFATKLRNDEDQAARARALAKGMVDGNPPWDQAKLDADNQSDRVNVNFREGEAYLAKGVTSFYDAITEAPSVVECTTEFGGPERAGEYSRIITEEAHNVLSKLKGMDGRLQTSIYNMVLYGIGPMFFHDSDCILPCIVKPGNLMVPQDTPSDVSDWPACVIFQQMDVDKLEECIEEEAAANAVGWNLKAVKKAIIGSNLKSEFPNSYEYHQQKIRNNQLGSCTEYGKVDLAHIYYKEKNEKISHLIVNMANNEEFLYEAKGEYECWKECVWPGYYDRGDGEHHSVKGMGVKMYSVLDIKNKQLCQAMDSAFDQTSNYLIPADQDSAMDFAVIQKGVNRLLPPGTQIIPRQLSHSMEVPMLANRMMDGILTNNLSQYNETLNKPQGNPRTAFEVNAILSQQQTISKTQLTRYYEQWDDLRAEQVRRLLKGKEECAKEFLEAVRKRGVPKDALKDLKVKAGRVAGQGSAFLRTQTLAQILQLAASLPESGRVNLIRDWIASLLGQNMVDRYMPLKPQSRSDQREFQFATLELGSLIDGIIPIVSEEDNHTIHLAVHMKAATDAFESLMTGKTDDPYENAAFIGAILKHVQAHLQAMATDPLKAQDMQQAAQQYQILEQMAQAAPQQAKQLAEQAAQGQQQGADPEQMRKEAEHINNERRKDEALAADIERKNQKQSQLLALKDAQVAEGMRRTRQQDAAKMEMTVAKAAVDTEIKKEKAKAEPKKKPAEKK